MQEPIYLDNNSTTPLDPRVADEMLRAWREFGANPASQHALGRKARRKLEEAREGIAELLGAKTSGMDADQVIFTSGGTEANNLALRGLLRPGDALLISPIEHPSIAMAAAELRREGAQLSRFAVGTDGRVQTDERCEKCAGEKCESEKGKEESAQVVSLMLANNETGVIQPVGELAAQFGNQGARVHTDAVQAVGKIPVHFRALGVAAMTVAPHKFHGPLGIGALVVRHGIELAPQFVGGFQQAGLRAGTESVALAVGFYEALVIATAKLPERAAHMQAQRDELERQLRAELPDLVVIGADTPRLPNTSCVAFPGLDRQQLVMALDVAGVACSTGSACASGSSEPSPTLVAMGLPKVVIESAIRLSLSPLNRADEVAEAARRISSIVKHLRSLK
jgi:cysteine desulfurase